MIRSILSGTRHACSVCELTDTLLSVLFAYQYTKRVPSTRESTLERLRLNCSMTFNRRLIPCCPDSKHCSTIFNRSVIPRCPDSKHWRESANEELEEALSYKWNTNAARNVIVFVGDGMSPDTITASRIYSAGETGRLAWENFPHIGILKVLVTSSFRTEITK